MSATALTEIEKAKLYKSCPIVPEIGEIRVLQVLPGLPGDELRCRLLKTTLTGYESSKPRREYEALSYTWSGDSTTLTLNDKSGFDVTTNLAAAMRRLRYQYKPRTLWVDALCINQSDIAERNGQVKLMGDIFSNSMGVLVWLGDVQKTNSVLPLDQDGIWYETVHGERRYYTSPEVRPLGSMDISHTEMQRCALHLALHDTFPHWWERTWVVQEFCKAPANLQMCYGTYEESLDEFFSEHGLLCQLASRNKSDSTCQSFWHAQYRLNHIRTKVRQGPMSILDFAENCFQAAATDARDKAYSLRSMVSIDEARWIEPNYYASINSVFTRATFASIIGSGHLGILRYAWDTSSRDRSLPSWAVDFGDDGLLPNESIRDILRNVKLFEAPEPWIHISSYHSTQDPSLDLDTGMLTLAGRTFDSISSCEVFADISLVQDKVSCVTATQARRVTSMLNRMLGIENPRESVLLTDASKARSRTLLQYLIDIFQHWYKWSQSDSDTGRAANDLLTQYALFSATRYAADCTLFVTHGGYLGFSRGCLQVGDKVILLHGGPLPAILRGDDTGIHRFVGFAIVASLMGEPSGFDTRSLLEMEEYFAIL